MAVRDFMAVGRLRGAVKAAADAAIATKIAAGLLIFENMIDSALLRRRLVQTRPLPNKTSSESQRISQACGFSFERPIGGVEGRRIETKRVREDECLKIDRRGTRAPRRPTHTALTALDLADC